MIGEIKKHKENQLLIEFEESISPDFLELLADGGDNLVSVELLDNRRISQKQNALSHVLIADVARYSYDEPQWIESILKYYYKAKTGKEFSHRRATKHEAHEWIGFLIEFILKNNIPLEKRYQYLLEDNRWFYNCLKYRKCCICGKRAEIHHVDTVGMGNNRKRINNRGRRFAALCRHHHGEIHILGLTEFIDRYKIIPIIPDDETLKRLGLNIIERNLEGDRGVQREIRDLKLGTSEVVQL